MKTNPVTATTGSLRAPAIMYTTTHHVCILIHHPRSPCDASFLARPQRRRRAFRGNSRMLTPCAPRAARSVHCGGSPSSHLPHPKQNKTPGIQKSSGQCPMASEERYHILQSAPLLGRGRADRTTTTYKRNAKPREWGVVSRPCPWGGASIAANSVTTYTPGRHLGRRSVAACMSGMADSERLVRIPVMRTRRCDAVSPQSSKGGGGSTTAQRWPRSELDFTPVQFWTTELATARRVRATLTTSVLVW
ncbi:hypothetical protein C8Q70DRAFT_353488 [Cubamyces menziesii]|nr:hypothetical protein C8Q70DRAFT_353488 [Cubamyces menziesii]